MTNWKDFKPYICVETGDRYAWEDAWPIDMTIYFRPRSFEQFKEEL